MRQLRSFAVHAAVLALLGAGAAYAQYSQSGTAGEPTPDVKRSGVVNEKSAERPFDEMNPHKNYSNTEKDVDKAPVHAPPLNPGPNVTKDNAAGPQKSGETSTTTRK